MATARRKTTGNPLVRADLYNGDKMTREEFHSIYETLDVKIKAELLGGIVFISSPLKQPHALKHPRVNTLLDTYQAFTTGVQFSNNATVLLGRSDVVQPDLFLRILPEFGGQSKNSHDDYVAGAPELVVEIAHSSKSMNLHLKRTRYARAGVLEYIVVCLYPQKVYFFQLQSGKKNIYSSTDGFLKSTVFPGLWIDINALFEMDYTKSMDFLNQGLSSNEHSAFVDLLSKRKTIK